VSDPGQEREALMTARRRIRQMHEAGFDSRRKEIATDAICEIDAALAAREEPRPGFAWIRQQVGPGEEPAEPYELRSARYEIRRATEELDRAGVEKIDNEERSDSTDDSAGSEWSIQKRISMLAATAASVQADRLRVVAEKLQLREEELTHREGLIEARERQDALGEDTERPDGVPTSVGPLGGSPNETVGELGEDTERPDGPCSLCVGAMPDGEWCRACGLGKPELPAKSEPRSPILEAVRKARGNLTGAEVVESILATHPPGCGCGKHAEVVRDTEQEPER
jgi:hypothetical protein